MATDEELIREAELAKALEDANAAYNAAPSDEAYAAHNRAQEALHEHRAAHAPDRSAADPDAGPADAAVVPETVTADAAPQEG